MLQHKKHYSNRIRDSHSDWYRTSSWQRVRRKHLNMEPLCRACHAIAVDVDHIIPRKDRPDLQFNHDNLQSLCHSCHSKKTSEERLKGGRG